jgi:hypothetical protein
MLERVHGVMAQGRLVEEGQMPDVEVHGPQWEGDERVREHAKTAHGPHREQRPQDGAGEAGDDAERREVAEQEVLDHVKGERLQGELFERPGEGDDEQEDAEPEDDGLPDRQRRPSAAQPAHAQRIENRTDGNRQELQRVHRSSLGLHSSA